MNARFGTDSRNAVAWGEKAPPVKKTNRAAIEGSDGVDCLEHVDAGHVRHHEVADYEIEALTSRESSDGGVAVCLRHDVVIAKGGPPLQR